MKKTIFLLLFLTILGEKVPAQWQNIWSSGSIDGTFASGWFSFEKSGDIWLSRLYTTDSVSFQVCSAGFSITPEYTYNFATGEKAAGYQFYSLGYDLTGDGKVEFYVLSYDDASTYLQSFKIVDITTGNIVFQKKSLNFSYSYPTLSDLNGDGLLECIVAKNEYPYQNKYYYEIYNTGITGVKSTEPPAKFSLSQNFPNPFNPETKISFTLTERKNVSIKIFNIQGELVKTLLTTEFQLGDHEVVWNGENEFAQQQPTGIYFYEMRSGSYSQAKKMILLR
jgi:hypothetical protein